MYILEIIIILLLMATLIWMFTLKSARNKYLIAITVVTIILLLMNVSIRGSRWQLYPLYSVVTLIVFMGVFNGLQQKRQIRFLILFLSITLIIISGVSKFVFPVYEMPYPNGDSPIGTESFIVIDESRDEAYGLEGKRKVKLQLWYPAETTEGYDRIPWLEDGRVVAKALAIDTGLPSFVLNHTELVMSNSYSNAPLSDEENNYPVVVISHGWRGFRNLHTDLAEELASMGYIVVGIDHTYGSVATVFSEEEIAYLNLDALPDREDTPDFLNYANTLVNTYAGDITLTINELERMNSGIDGSRFEGKINLENIGLLGHSTGGGAGVAVAITDNRIDAIFGMDSWVEPINNQEIEKGLDIPTIFLRSESWETGLNNEKLMMLVEENISNTRLYQIDGTTHYDFSMAYMYSPLTKPLGMTGELEGEYLVQIIKSMMLDFFNQTLKVNNNGEHIYIKDDWVEVRKIR